MGLDIYLYSREQAEHNAAYDKASAEWYGEDLPDGVQSPYDRATEDEREQWRQTHDSARHADAPSEKYPNHLFNRRYLRSSYNGAGFDRAVPQMLGRDADLAWVFSPVRLDDQYDVELTAASVAGLREAKARALGIVEELRDCDQLKVSTVAAFNMFAGAGSATDSDALAWYRKQREQNRNRKTDEDWSWYSTRGGSVYGAEGMVVLAAAEGVDVLGTPAVHLIYKGDASSYIESAEIVAEFCDEAIALIERDGGCQISWSG